LELAVRAGRVYFVDATVRARSSELSAGSGRRGDRGWSLRPSRCCSPWSRSSSGC